MSVNSDRSPLLLELRKTAARHTRHSNRRGRRGRPLRDAGESTRRLDLPLCQIGGRLSADVDLIDIDDERSIDEVDFPRSGHPTSRALSACHSLSYTTCTVFRQDVNKLCIDDSKLQIGDSKCATVAYECDGAVTQRHPGAAKLKSQHSKSQERQGSVMARFPSRENDIAVLAEDLIAGLSEHTEFAANSEEGKLNLLGWGPRSSSKRLEPPARPRDLEVARSGKGWVFLDWKPPLLGGGVAAYKVQVARPEEGAWKDVGMSIETEILVNDQERSVDLQFHVIAVNRAGEGGPSNIVRVVLLD